MPVSEPLHSYLFDNLLNFNLLLVFTSCDGKQLSMVNFALKHLHKLWDSSVTCNLLSDLVIMIFDINIP